LLGTGNIRPCRIIVQIDGLHHAGASATATTTSHTFAGVGISYHGEGLPPFIRTGTRRNQRRCQIRTWHGADEVDEAEGSDASAEDGMADLEEDEDAMIRDFAQDK